MSPLTKIHDRNFLYSAIINGKKRFLNDIESISVSFNKDKGSEVTLRFQNKTIHPAEMKVVYDDFPNEKAKLVIEKKKFRSPEAKKIQEAGEFKNIDKNLDNV